MDVGLLLEQFYGYSLYLALIPLAIGLLRWLRLSQPLRAFWFVILGGFCVSLVSEWFIANHINNHFLMYANTLVDAVLMCVFFSGLPPFVDKSRYWLIGVCGLFLLFMGFSIWYWGHSFHTTQLLSCTESLIILLAVLMLLRWQFRQSIHQSLRQTPIVWILTGVLLTNAITVILSIFGSILYSYSGPFFNLFWDTLAPISLLIYYGFTCIGFWQNQL
jgi:hypothetical protein